MKKLAKLLKIYSVLIISTMLVAGCSKNNPMLNDEVIIKLRNLSLDSVPECIDYYANSMADNTKQEKCDKWSKDTYIMMHNAGVISQNATLDDFRDPQVWKKVQPLKQN